MRSDDVTENVVLDSYAVLALLNGESGADEVVEALRRIPARGGEVSLCTINWGEVLYITARRGGARKREVARLHMANLPLTLVQATQELVEQAARLKAQHPLSYADAFCAATALQRSASVLTGDREFEAVEGDITIHWLP